jgi:hypothetical protein
MTDDQPKYTLDYGKAPTDLFKNSSGQYGMITQDGAFVMRSSDNSVIGGGSSIKNASNKDINIDDFYDDEPEQKKQKKKRPFRMNANQIGKGMRRAGNVISSVSNIAEILVPEYAPVLEAVKDGATILKSSGRVVRGYGKIAKSAKNNGTNGIQGKRVEKLVKNVPIDALTKMTAFKYKGPVKRKYRSVYADGTITPIRPDMMPKPMQKRPLTKMDIEKYNSNVSRYDIF